MALNLPARKMLVKDLKVCENVGSTPTSVGLNCWQSTMHGDQVTFSIVWIQGFVKVTMSANV